MQTPLTEDALPWKLQSFQQRPTSKRDCWAILPGWVIRVHGSERTQPFHPLHSSFPLHEEGGETLCSRRVTVAFLEGHNVPSMFEDSWMTSPSPESRNTWKSRGKWVGFTFFSRKSVDAHGTQAGSGSIVGEDRVGTQQEIIETAVEAAADHLAGMTLRRGYAHGGVAARGKAAIVAKPVQHHGHDDYGFELVQEDL